MRLGSGGQCVPNFGILSIGFHRPPSLGNPYRLAMSQGYSADSHHAHSSHGLSALSRLPLASSPSLCFLTRSLILSHPASPSLVVACHIYGIYTDSDGPRALKDLKRI